jgi:hypothetical protein
MVGSWRKETSTERRSQAPEVTVDEDLVGVVAGCHDTGNEETGHVGLHGRRVVVRHAGLRIALHAHGLKQARIGVPPRHGEDPIVVNDLGLPRVLPRQDHGVCPNLGHPDAPLHSDLTSGDPVSDVRENPGLHSAVQILGEVDHGHAGSGSIELKGGLDGGVAPAHDKDVLISNA